MVELVSSMIVDLKLRVADFNQKVNSAMVEVKRLGEQVNELTSGFAKLGAIGAGALVGILASSPEAQVALSRLKLLWLDMAREMGKRLAPDLEFLARKLEELWNWIKAHPLVLDFLVIALEVGAIIGALGLAAGLIKVSPTGLLLTLGISLEILIASEAKKRLDEIIADLTSLRNLLGFDEWTFNAVKSVLTEMYNFMGDSWETFKKDHPILAGFMGLGAGGDINFSFDVGAGVTESLTGLDITGGLKLVSPTFIIQSTFAGEEGIRELKNEWDKWWDENIKK